MEAFHLKIGKAMGWTAAYFGIMLFYTFLDVAVWRKVFPHSSNWLNIITITLCVCGFLTILRKTGYRIRLSANITPSGLWP